MIFFDDENKRAKRAPFIEKKRGTHTGEKLSQTTSQPRQEHEKKNTTTSEPSIQNEKQQKGFEKTSQ